MNQKNNDKENEDPKESAKPQEDWMQKKWRPAMGWMYMMVCIFDFIVFPIMWTVVQFWETEAANDAFRQWGPLTLSGAGLFHMAMGAVLGISAWSRGQEKIAGANAGPGLGSMTSSSMMPTSNSSFGQSNYSSQPTQSWGGQPLGMNPMSSTPNVGSFGSASYNQGPKNNIKGPPQEPHPLI